jgi:hypothetical protein
VAIDTADNKIGVFKGDDLGEIESIFKKDVTRISEAQI